MKVIDKPARTPAVKKDTAPPVLLAHIWDVNTDPTGWWISEKCDGCRSWWDGVTFITRLGNTFNAPDWFKAKLPKDIVLDGELWIGRGKFQKTISAIKDFIPNDEKWKEVKYIVYDAPKIPGTFEERLKFLNSFEQNDILHVLTQTP